MKLLGVPPRSLLALDRRTGGRIVVAIREVIESGLQPTIDAWRTWSSTRRRVWRLVIRGVDDRELVANETVLEIDTGEDLDPGVLALVAIHLDTYRAELISGLTRADDPAINCPRSSGHPS